LPSAPQAAAAVLAIKLAEVEGIKGDLLVVGAAVELVEECQVGGVTIDHSENERMRAPG
jgi:hypothetical protein